MMDFCFRQRLFPHYTDVNNATVPKSPAPQVGDLHSKEASAVDSGLRLLVDTRGPQGHD
jgi:hypothetical protein